MAFSKAACEILDLFRENHRRPGARMTLATLDAHLGTDPAIIVAVSELKEAGLLETPDADSVELTPKGFDAIQLGLYRTAAD